MNATYSVPDQSRWDIETRDHQQVNGLTTTQLKELLYQRRLSPEDWATLSGTDDRREIGQHDVFFDAIPSPTLARRREREAIDEELMDMTPMIDVVFLLLIFFMITATFHLQTGMQFPPTADETESAEDIPAPGLSEIKDAIKVEVSQSDEYTIRQDGQSGQPVEPSDLSLQIAELSAAKNLNRVLVVAHELASLEAVVTAFDAAANAGVGDVSLADLKSLPLPSAGAAIQVQGN